MKFHKHIFSIFALCTIPLFGMDDTSPDAQMKQAITARDWKRVVAQLQGTQNSNDVHAWAEVLTKSEMDLNAVGKENVFLLNELLLSPQKPSFRHNDDPYCYSNTYFVLKELIKHNKLDPQLQLNGQPIVAQLDTAAASLTDNQYYKILQDISQNIRIEKDNTFFKSRTRSLERILLGLGGFFILSLVYAWYTDKPKPADEDTADGQQGIKNDVGQDTLTYVEKL